MDPWEYVGRVHPDVLIELDDLDHAHAYWHPGERVILLDRKLGQAEGRWHLCHELCHLEHGDEALFGPDGPRLDRRQERRADEWAAVRLITVDDLADGLLWAQNEPELAEQLHLPVQAVRARLRKLTDEESAYIDSRIAAREAVA